MIRRQMPFLISFNLLAVRLNVCFCHDSRDIVSLDIESLDTVYVCTVHTVSTVILYVFCACTVVRVCLWACTAGACTVHTVCH